MATSVVNPGQGAQISGQDDELSQVVRQVIQEELARNPVNQQQTQAAPVVTAQPITVNLNGQDFQFANQEELNRALNQTFNAYNQQIASLQPQGSRATGADVRGNDEPTFDLNKFVEKMTTNPIDAFNYVDEARFGVKDPAAKIKEALGARQQLDQINQTLAVYQFKDAHKEFPETPQAVAQLAQIMQSRGLPVSVQGLENAYAVGVMKGVFAHPALARQQQQAVPPPQQYDPFNPYGQPPAQPQFYGGMDPRAYNGGAPLAPPSVSRTAQEAPPDLFKMAENMSPEQIQAVFDRFQQ